MILDVDYLIIFFEKNSDNLNKEEMEEQDSKGSSSVPKWETTYNIKRSKANMLGKKGEKWTTGLNRGAANQIW